jgi:hypothetical protein
MACERLELTPGPSASDGGRPDASLPPFSTVAVDGGSFTIARAVSDTQFIAFDFDQSTEVPFVDALWDIAFRRQRIRLRGGVNGDGGVCATPVVDAGFAEVTAIPPESTCVFDAADGDDANSEPDTVFENAATWYAYNPMSHVLTPRPIVYVVRSDMGEHYKVAIEGYYDMAGTPAVLQMRWAPMPVR